MRVQTSADYSTIEAISERLIEAANRIGNLADAVAKARQVQDYDTDRRKRALSCSVMDFLSKGDSATAAEHKARASESYNESMNARASELENALVVIAQWDAEKIKWETARSLLSVQKSLVANL